MTTLGILETDTLYDDLIDDYRSYGHMFARLFETSHCVLEIRYYQVQQGEFPRSAQECDAYLITGSKAGVYDALPWIDRLCDWIQSFYRQNAKIIGICFGHQIIAHSLGGKAAKSEKGWGLGVLNVETLESRHWMNPAPAIFRLIYSHQDQVLQLPAGATPLLGNSFCPIAGYCIGDQVLSLQGHPEFTEDYFRRLIAHRRNRIKSDQIEEALSSLQQITDDQLVARWIYQFITERTL